MILFFVYFMVIYKLQKAIFINAVDQKIGNWLILLCSVLYLIGSVIFIRVFDLPFRYFISICRIYEFIHPLWPFEGD
jgi:hypothetical protein